MYKIHSLPHTLKWPKKVLFVPNKPEKQVETCKRWKEETKGNNRQININNDRMASGLAAGDGFFRVGGFEGCITSCDMEITRRPYHRNCSCALHKMRGKCSHVSHITNISYPIRRVWSEGSLAFMVSTNSSSPCSSPVASSTTNISLGDWEVAFWNVIWCEEQQF